MTAKRKKADRTGRRRRRRRRSTRGQTQFIISRTAQNRKAAVKTG
jgi:hypothetical protein